MLIRHLKINVIYDINRLRKKKISPQLMQKEPMTKSDTHYNKNLSKLGIEGNFS